MFNVWMVEPSPHHPAVMGKAEVYDGISAVYVNPFFEGEEKDKIREKIMHLPKDVIILSHTCPKKYIPFEKSLIFEADTAMEMFLDEFERKVYYKKWYCGHWHINHKIDKIHFLYEDIVKIE